MRSRLVTKKDKKGKEFLAMEPLDNFIQYDKEIKVKDSTGEHTYHLYSVVHFVQNTQRRGDKHYVTEARNLNANESWYILDDHKPILRKPDGAEGKSDSAYILYYHRADNEVHYTVNGKAFTRTSQWARDLNRIR